MTPEERAKDISSLVRVDADGRLMFDGQDNNPECLLTDAIAAAIREAILAEREACASLARELDMPDDLEPPTHTFIEGWQSACAHIAAAIRARGS
jgi:hypothetical protein